MIKTDFVLTALAALLLTAAGGYARDLPDKALGTVEYEVHYQWGGLNAKVATATISMEPGSRDRQQAYHSRALIQASSIFRLFISHDYIADTWLRRSDLQPLFFSNPYKKNNKDCTYEYTYDQASRKILSRAVKPDSDEPEETTFRLDGKTMDLLSLLHFIRFYDVKPSGKPLAVQILMAGKAFPGLLTFEGVDKDHVPGRETERFLLKLTEHGLMENGSGNEIHLWRSPDADRQLLGLEVPLSTGFMSVTAKESD